MSSNPEAVSRNADDPRQIELVSSLAEKTSQGKIPWVKQRNAISAALPDGLSLNFVTQRNLMGNFFWQLFTVRDARGNELVRANPIDAVLAFSKSEKRPLLTAVEGLFEAVQRSTSEELNKAIHSVKSL
jgi:hypothetical protein